MGDRKFFVIANPHSGRHRHNKILSDLTTFFDQSLASFQIFETQSSQRGQATLEKNLDKTYSDLVIVGGDGTINEAVNGLNFDIPVSFIPAGSGDDFVKNIDIGTSLHEQFNTALNGDINRIDLGICNGRKFLNGVGIGFDGQIVSEMKERKVPLLSGQAKYYFHVLHILSGYKHRNFDLDIDGETSKEKLILLTVANGTTFGGGFKLTPEARIDDGLLDICMIGRISALKRYFNILRLQNGSHGILPEVNFDRVKKIKIGPNPSLQGHIDGEDLGTPPFDIDISPGALAIRTASTV